MNKLDNALRAQILRSLCEGCGIRPTARLFDVRPNTVMNLMAEAGELCHRLHDEHVRGLQTVRVQMDEIWAFVGAKKHRCTDLMKGQGMGDAWSWLAIDADSRLIVSYVVSHRDTSSAMTIAHDLRDRITSEDVQLSTDQLASYGPAIRDAFGCNAHHGRLVKVYGRENPRHDGKYSPSVLVATEKSVMSGNPDPRHISTSYSERFNLSLRMQNRRYTRLTNGHSKKLENLRLSLALTIWSYNFCRPHQSLDGMTPAQFPGLADRKYTMDDLVSRL